MEHDAWFFVGVFAFIFLIWIATGGPTHPIALTGPSLAQPQELGGGTYLGLPRANFGFGGTNISLPGSSNGSPTGSSGGSPSNVFADVPGVSFAPLSPFSNVVSISHFVSNASSSDPKSEYVQISVAQNASGPVDITKWTLGSGATGNSEIIPKGTAVPTSGVVNAADDIKLEPGDTAFIISGESPVGASFRENKCIGYFSSFQQFSPSLPQSCPSAPDELNKFYGTPFIHDPSCIDFADSLSRCQVAVIPLSSTLSLTCREFMESHINYNGCLSAHRDDQDFNGTTWRIYLGRTEPLWRAKHEVVELLDSHGKTVDTFSY